MRKFTLILFLLLSGCKNANNESNNEQTPVTKIDKTPELIQELKDQPTIDDQFSIIYDKFEPILDRSDSLTGPDENADGIRDDVEAFIDALEVTEPVRKALKQDAKFMQENLHYDFSEKNDTNIVKALEIANKHNKVIACKRFVGIPVRDRTNTSRTIEALTYNTKSRTMAYLTYNHLLDGSTSISLPAKEEYCE
ncbi:UPF0325 protein YaeH [Moritella sp. JT01]|uniref:chromosome partitioning protein ParA n=1 Tax=Moritella sp. JT01 TaxID=756698 RepID=UPI00079B8D42|nr:chromosome partitioning protein ParA [Moritella sp. JT01]KXO13126.1 UPF0325 protein YaeH [Moritella sp. JT01]